VLLHGGGAQTRDFFWVTHFFARRGFAVLAYDKRGVGGSTGDWRTATFRDLAGDALAAVDWLRARSDIRADRIGLYGSSAGGWTAPFAAAAAPDRIAFVIVRSGSYLMERQNVVHEVEGDMRSAGYGDTEVARMRALHALAMAARDEESWERLRAALAEMQSAPWAELTRLPRSLVAWASPGREADILDFVASQHRTDFDVLSTWAQLDMPVLYQVGERDRYVPGPESAARIAAALAHNPHALARVYPRGDHPMFESETGYPRDIGNVTRYAEGYLPDLDRFVRDQARPTR
jgi:pimeloyl-ACP methyl ester carboxylesterase